MEGKNKRKFTGFSIDFGNIWCNNFDGYGFCLPGVGVNFTGTVTWTTNYKLFLINWKKNYERRGQYWKLYMHLLGFKFEVFRWVIVPMQEYCVCCKEEFQKKGYEPYCGAWCKEDSEIK